MFRRRNVFLTDHSIPMIKALAHLGYFRAWIRRFYPPPLQPLRNFIVEFYNYLICSGGETISRIRIIYVHSSQLLQLSNSQIIFRRTQYQLPNEDSYSKIVRDKISKDSIRCIYYLCFENYGVSRAPKAEHRNLRKKSSRDQSSALRTIGGLRYRLGTDRSDLWLIS